MAKPLWLAVTVIFCSIQSATCQGKSIKCSSGTFTKCQSAKVSCTFTEDIRKTRKNFNIVHYPFNRVVSHSDAGTYVLVCNWGQGVDGLECKTEEGYMFNKNVSDTLSLDIPDVSYRLAGVYVCQMVPDENIPLETCTLTVEAAAESQAAKDTGLSACPAVDCGKDDLIVVVLVVVIIILVVIIVFILSTLLLILKKRRPTNEDYWLCFGKSGTTESTPLAGKTETQTSSGGDQNENNPYDESKERLLPQNENLPRNASAGRQLDTTVNAGSAGTNRPAKTTTGAQGAQGKSPENRALPSPPKDGNSKQGVSPLMGEQIQPRNLNTKEFRTWDNNAVCLWLKKVGLERFVDNFKAKKITGQNLIAKPGLFSKSSPPQPMTSSDLKKIGIVQNADQEAVRREIGILINGDK